MNCSQIHSPYLGIKSTMVWGCRIGQPMYPDGPVRQPYAIVNFIPTVSDYLKGAAAGQPPTSPPRPVPPPTPLWLSGQLPPSQRGRGSGLHNTNQRGGGPVRDNARGGNRGADRGQRGPLRGGQRGRWGRW